MALAIAIWEGCPNGRYLAQRDTPSIPSGRCHAGWLGGGGRPQQSGRAGGRAPAAARPARAPAPQRPAEAPPPAAPAAAAAAAKPADQSPASQAAAAKPAA